MIAAVIRSILKVVKEWFCDLWVIPAMPDITTSRLIQGRRRLFAKRSEMNVAEEALFSKVLAIAHEPLGDFTRTRYVISISMPSAIAERIPCRELPSLALGLTFVGFTRAPSMRHWPEFGAGIKGILSVSHNKYARASIPPAYELMNPDFSLSWWFSGLDFFALWSGRFDSVACARKFRRSWKLGTLVEELLC